MDHDDPLTVSPCNTKLPVLYAIMRPVEMIIKSGLSHHAYPAMSRLAPLLQQLGRVPLPLLRGFGQTLAGVLLRVPTRTAGYARLNLDIARPFIAAELTDSQWRHLVRQAQRNELLSYLEFVSIWGSTNRRNISRIGSVSNQALFEQALTTQNGIVLVVPHLGTWEVMNAWLSQYTAMTVMYKPVKQPDANQFVLNARSREGAHLVPADERGVRQLFVTLKRGGVTAILPDHSPEQPVPPLIDWFGVPLYSSQLIAKLLYKTGASGLLAYAIRQPDGKFALHFEPIDPAVMQQDSVSGTQALHVQLQQLIARYPAHYHWSYKRFKASPATTHLYTQPHAESLALIRQLQANRTPVTQSLI